MVGCSREHVLYYVDIRNYTEENKDYDLIIEEIFEAKDWSKINNNEMYFNKLVAEIKEKMIFHMEDKDSTVTAEFRLVSFKGHSDENDFFITETLTPDCNKHFFICTNRNIVPSQEIVEKLIKVSKAIKQKRYSKPFINVRSVKK